MLPVDDAFLTRRRGKRGEWENRKEGLRRVVNNLDSSASPRLRVNQSAVEHE